MYKSEFGVPKVMLGLAVTGIALLLLGLFAISWKADWKRFEERIGEKARSIVSLVLVLSFAAAAAGTLAFGTYLDRSHDIDDAIVASSQHFVHGGNPYRDEVVPRFTEVYHEGAEMTNGTLNYLPATLFVYSGAYLAFGFLGPIWYELMNAILGIITAFILSKTFPSVRKGILFPSVGIVTVFFLFDNIMLTLSFFSIFLYYALRSDAKYATFTALVCLFLAFSVKFAGILSLGAYVLFTIQRKGLRDRNALISLSLFAVVGVLACLLSIALFGFRDLMDSTFLFMSDPDVRSEDAYFGGTVLAETVGPSPLFSPISIGILLAAITATMFVKGLLPRLFLVEIVLPFVAVKDSQALLAIPLLLVLAFIALRVEDARTDRMIKRAAYG